MLAATSVFQGHVAPLHVVEREVVVVVNGKHWHGCSEASKCRAGVLLRVHAADCAQVAGVGVDVVAEQHEGISIGMQRDVIEKSVADVHALREILFEAEEEMRDW